MLAIELQCIIHGGQAQKKFNALYMHDSVIVCFCVKTMGS